MVCSVRQGATLSDVTVHADYMPVVCWLNY